MDKAVRLHHACLRRLLRPFNGYESATEVWVSCPSARKSPFEAAPRAKGEREGERAGDGRDTSGRDRGDGRDTSGRAVNRMSSLHRRMSRASLSLQLPTPVRLLGGGISSPASPSGGGGAIAAAATASPVGSAPRLASHHAAFADSVADAAAAVVAAASGGAGGSLAGGSGGMAPRLSRVMLRNIAASWRFPARRHGGGSGMPPASPYRTEEFAVQLVQRERMSVSGVPGSLLPYAYGSSGGATFGGTEVDGSMGAGASGGVAAERASGSGPGGRLRRQQGSICAAYGGGLQDPQLGTHLHQQLLQLQSYKQIHQQQLPFNLQPLYNDLRKSHDADSFLTINSGHSVARTALGLARAQTLGPSMGMGLSLAVGSSGGPAGGARGGGGTTTAGGSLSGSPMGRGVMAGFGAPQPRWPQPRNSLDAVPGGWVRSPAGLRA
ncbi:hypothetical protein GPECTOR_51g698 [Gonium pectorale]|uniref:Uncharacterized protein n=1 Tax=Gonium pectorale TaxID=33097 RepID=A0A150G790_GONPE|nr:hypothetical protein GPECTOR_51g698 [Gonium pectorale]|eukprot:KXZ45712.1 hypothetical protein GPECTOR_51g698 [Gonium pectorale]